MLILDFYGLDGEIDYRKAPRKGEQDCWAGEEYVCGKDALGYCDDD